MNATLHSSAPDIAASTAASWFNIRWRPNPSTGEVLNIGVLARAADGSRDFRLLRTFDRVKCLYDDALAEQAQFMTTMVGHALAAGSESFPSPQVFLSEAKPMSGNAGIIDELFRTTVPLARPRKDAVETLGRMQTQDDYSVRREVIDELKRIGGLKADRVIRSEPFLFVKDNSNRNVFLDIPLQSNSAFGTIVSARQKTFDKFEIALARAETDLLVARSKFQGDRLFMYVVRRPDGSHNRRSAEEMDGWLGEHAWKLQNIGVNLRSSTEIESAAEDISRDMGIAA